MKRALIVTGLAALLASAAAQAALVQQRTPFFASIAASKARMRTGPGRNYPASWLYVREDLPVRVLVVYGEWRKVEDPDGTQGWMLANLLSARRSAMVMGQMLEMREAPRFGARVLWRAAPRVVGRISKCDNGWCWLDVHGRAGFVEASHLWGVEPGEKIG